MTIHEELEAELAAFKHTEAVLTFQSGFTANTGRHPDDHRRDRPDRLGRAQPRLDHRRHAAVEGPAQGLPARRRRRAARGAPRGAGTTGRDGHGEPYRLILVVTDGVFSMDGDIAPLPGIVEAAEAYGAAVMVDDAHASGVLGTDGRGSVSHFGLEGRVAIQVGHAVEGGRRGRRVRGRLAGAARRAHPARPAVPVLDVAAARRRRRLPGGDPDHGRGAGAHRAAVGQHPPVQGRARPAGLRHRHGPRPRSRP